MERREETTATWWAESVGKKERSGTFSDPLITKSL